MALPCPYLSLSNKPIEFHHTLYPTQLKVNVGFTAQIIRLKFLSYELRLRFPNYKQQTQRYNRHRAKVVRATWGQTAKPAKKIALKVALLRIRQENLGKLTNNAIFSTLPPSWHLILQPLGDIIIKLSLRPTRIPSNTLQRHIIKHRPLKLRLL